jgi:hypothetical protein
MLHTSKSQGRIHVSSIGVRFEVSHSHIPHMKHVSRPYARKLHWSKHVSRPHTPKLDTTYHAFTGASHAEASYEHGLRPSTPKSHRSMSQGCMRLLFTKGFVLRPHTPTPRGLVHQAAYTVLGRTHPRVTVACLKTSHTYAARTCSPGSKGRGSAGVCAAERRRGRRSARAARGGQGGGGLGKGRRG